MKRFVKLLHILGAVGMTGALAAHAVLLTLMPEPSSLAEYASMRQAIAGLARWLLLPSLTLVLISGLAAIAVHAAFREARWVWLKAALGLTMFEGTLAAVQSPAEQAARLSARVLAGEADPGMLDNLLRNEWAALWVILSLALVNIVVGVWRPSLRRRRVS